MQHLKYSYDTKGTCSTNITFDIDNGVVTNIVFTGGCDGNLQAVPKLVDGWTAEQISAKLAGINCSGRGTSCADQLARAVTKAAQKEK